MSGAVSCAIFTLFLIMLKTTPTVTTPATLHKAAYTRTRSAERGTKVRGQLLTS